MATTLYASFIEPADAERAAGALLDEGASSNDLSIITSERYAGSVGQVAKAEVAQAEKAAKQGITTTTAADAAMGAAKGMTIGSGVGIAAALAALLVPGVGIVLGTGALALAFAGAVGTAVAGGAAGGVVGYLKDQGMAEDIVSHYSDAYGSGGAILALAVPTGNLDTEQAEGILVKYGATNVSNSVAPQNTLDSQDMPPANFVPVREDLETAQVVPPVLPMVLTTAPVVETVTDPLTGLTEAVIPVSAVRPTRIDPLTGQATEGLVTDPVSGIDQVVRIENGRVVYVV
jgi:hypothetical protein